MRPTPNQDKVVPDSFRIILRQYLGKPEVKSLAPDGRPCSGTTQGLLQRATINAGKIVPVGKETDRRWEQGEEQTRHCPEKGLSRAGNPVPRDKRSDVAIP